MIETDLVKLFIERIPFKLPHARAFRRNVVDEMSARGYRIIAGIAGQADVYVYAKGGRVVEVEAKSAKGSMRQLQLKWAAFCRAWGVPHMVIKATAGEEPLQTVDRWIEELREVLG
jgi:hypothetical protein